MNKSFFKTILPVAACLVTGVMLAQPSTTPYWTKTYNNTSAPTHNDYVRAVTTDISGNVYVTGNANFYSGGDYSTTTIKYNRAGTVLWTKNFNTSIGGNCPAEGGYAIAVDDDFNVWVAASCTGTYTGLPNDNLALLKYNSSGVLQPNYPKYYGTNACGVNGAGGYAIAIYGTDVYIGGNYFNGTSYKFVVLKDNPSGANWGWSNTAYTAAGTSGLVEHRCMDIKATANGVYATGYSASTGQGKNIWTVGLDPLTGYLLGGASTSWPQTYNGIANGDDFGNAITINTEGGTDYVYIAGSTTTNTESINTYVAKFSTSGALQSGFPVMFDGDLHADAWNDIESAGGGSPTTPAVYVGGYTTDDTGNYFYGLAAVSTTGSIPANWPEVEIYRGWYTPYVAGANRGYAIEYSPATNRVYITGTTADCVAGNCNILDVNITTIGYDGTTSDLVWGPAVYDGGVNSLDQSFTKNSLKVIYNSCLEVDFIHVGGATTIAGHGLDYVTIKYGEAIRGCPIVERHAGSAIAGESSLVYGLYPNPFSTTTELVVAPEVKITNAVVLIYDLAGKVVASIPNLSSNHIQIERGYLAKGLYYFKLVEGRTTLLNGKFIIAD